MQNQIKYISSFLIALCISFFSIGAVHAETLDPGRIVVSSDANTQIVYTLYKVGTMNEDGKFIADENISKQGVSDINIDSSFDADKLAHQLAALDLSGMTSEKADAGNAGSVSFDDLDSGAYLIIASPSESKYTAKPMLALLQAPDEYDIKAKISEKPTIEKEKKEAPKLFANDQSYLYALISAGCLVVALASLIIWRKNSRV